MALPEVTTATFAEQVLKSDKPVLVDFWGPRCQPCIALMPAVEALAQQHADHLKVVKVNANARENWELCRTQSVMGLPAYLIFRDGQEIKRMAGANVTRETIVEALDELFKEA
ncbi:MAG TPA: thioredoxin family protein [Anaerolineae bacterium]|nr:thioredoxin family protein [Anaerolineae bacterium]